MLGRYIFRGNISDSIPSSLAKVSSIIWEMNSLPPLTDGNLQFLQARAGWFILNKIFNIPGKKIKLV